MNALQLLLTFFTQRNFVADYLQAKSDFLGSLESAQWTSY